MSRISSEFVLKRNGFL